MPNHLILLSCMALLLVATLPTVADWRPAEAPLMSRWAEDVTPENVHREYPRPQMVRDAWLNLNGLWDYAILDRRQQQPEQFDGRILVPFPVESALSGVGKQVGDQQRLWYRRTFDMPDNWVGQRVLLHFGAVDWQTNVWVNGQHVGEHRGGYNPFHFDITHALTAEGPQTVQVAVWDPTNAGYQPRGKQVRNPQGIWYTSVTGIWQTVWLEPVPQESSIESLRITPDIDAGLVTVKANTRGHTDASVTARVTVTADGRQIAQRQGPANQAISLAIEDARLWSPDDPFLYDLNVALLHNEQRVDQVAGYFGMRKISLDKDERGITRIMLNNEFVFQFGLLDQGWWPDGLYTAPSDDALRYDIEITKAMGFNMARKHVKVEPARWYYWADKLGLLVWQDMPSGDRYIGRDNHDIRRTAQSALQFEYEYLAMIRSFYNHPSIVMWVPFNEGWGQFDTPRIVELTYEHDATRLVNNASGWADRGVGDVIALHRYPGPMAVQPEEDRAAVLGEFGGLGLVVPGHLWQADENWGYRSYDSAEELEQAYTRRIERLKPLIAEPGLSAAVYTQTTDVEIEVNGLLTYDRKVIKLDVDKLAALHRQLYQWPGGVSVLLPSSQSEPHHWRYTTTRPEEQWMQPDFDDSRWQRGPAGFGTEGTPGAVVRTTWDSTDIWLRRGFRIDADELDPNAAIYLYIHHDEDAKVYLNGRLVAELTGYTTDYIMVPLTEDARQAIRPGDNVIAIHCHQTIGGQYIDAGITQLKPRQ